MEPLYGVLEMLVLRTLVFGPRHGYAIAGAIRDGSRDAVKIEFGSLYPALKRLELKAGSSRIGRCPNITDAPRSTGSPPLVAGGCGRRRRNGRISWPASRGC